MGEVLVRVLGLVLFERAFVFVARVRRRLGPAWLLLGFCLLLCCSTRDFCGAGGE